MKINVLLIIISLIIGNALQAQTKEELIAAIVKNNSYDGESGDMSITGDSEIPDKISSNNYENFEKLRRLLSAAELQEMAHGTNNILKVYAIEALVYENSDIDITALLQSEIAKKSYINTHDGCIVGYELVYHEIYHIYWNKIRLDALKNIEQKDKTEQESAMQQKLSTDGKMLQLDSIVIYNTEDIYWLIYDRAFSNRVFPESYIPTIETLAFTKSNAYAMEYLLKNYPEKYRQKFDAYVKTTFRQKKFRSENEITYLYNFTEIILKSNNQQLTNIVIAKFKAEKNWKSQSGWFTNLFEEYKISI